MTAIEFYFDYRSPFSYLAFTQLRGLGAEVSLHPFDILDLMKRVGNVPTSILCAPKGRYLRSDLARWVKRYGVAFERNPQLMSIDARRLLRATLAAGAGGDMAAAAGAIYSAAWGKPQPLGSPAEVAQVLSAAGLNGADLEPLIDSAGMDEALEAATSAAAERGVFGAPTFFIGEDMFFGNDRFDFIRERLGAAP